MHDIPATPRRRWFRFGLRTMFVVLTVFSLWLGFQAKIVQDRRQAILNLQSEGGSVFLSGQSGAGDPIFVNIPCWRRWLGDVAVVTIWTPRDYPESKCLEMQRQFPETAFLYSSTLRKMVAEPPAQSAGSSQN